MSDSLVGPQHVFVVHGRNTRIRDAMFDLLASAGLKPLEWSSALALTGEPNPFIGQVLERAFSVARAVVVLLTPDDLVSLDPSLQAADDPGYETVPTGQARPNVLFEAGMAIGRQPDRTVLVEIGTLRPFSDIAGRHILRFDGSIGRRLDLLRRLEAAGCSIDQTGERWQQAGDFALEGLGGHQSAQRLTPHGELVTPLPDLLATCFSARLEPPHRSPRARLMIRNVGDAAISKLSLTIPDDQPALVLGEVDPDSRILVPGQEATYSIAFLSDSLLELRVSLSGEAPGGSTFRTEKSVSFDDLELDPED